MLTQPKHQPITELSSIACNLLSRFLALFASSSAFPVRVPPTYMVAEWREMNAATIAVSIAGTAQGVAEVWPALHQVALMGGEASRETPAL